AVGLLEGSAGRQRARTVEDADVVEPEEAATEESATVDVLAIDPPGEVEDALLEHAREERQVARTALRGHLVDAPRRPGVHRRIHVSEGELVGGKLPPRLHVPLEQEEHE